MSNCFSRIKTTASTLGYFINFYHFQGRKSYKKGNRTLTPSWNLCLSSFNKFLICQWWAQVSSSYVLMMVINRLAWRVNWMQHIRTLKSSLCIDLAQVGPTLDQDMMISVGCLQHCVFTENNILDYSSREIVLFTLWQLKIHWSYSSLIRFYMMSINIVKNSMFL